MILKHAVSGSGPRGGVLAITGGNRCFRFPDSSMGHAKPGVSQPGLIESDWQTSSDFGSFLLGSASLVILHFLVGNLQWQGHWKGLIDWLLGFLLTSLCNVWWVLDWISNHKLLLPYRVLVLSELSFSRQITFCSYRGLAQWCKFVNAMLHRPEDSGWLASGIGTDNRLSAVWHAGGILQVWPWNDWYVVIWQGQYSAQIRCIWRMLLWEKSSTQQRARLAHKKACRTLGWKLLSPDTDAIQALRFGILMVSSTRHYLMICMMAHNHLQCSYYGQAVWFSHARAGRNSAESNC